LTLIGFHSDQSSTHSFHAIRYGRAAARCNQVSVGVEDFKPNDIRIPVPVAADLDDAREPLCQRPGSGGAKKEGLGHHTVSVAVSNAGVESRNAEKGMCTGRLEPHKKVCVPDL
jgi:hypothetical protein